MKTSAKGVKLIQDAEGLSLKPYLCPAQKWTWGWGHVMTPQERAKGGTITEAQALGMLHSDLIVYENAVTRLVTVPLTQGQFDALVSFTYNLGADALRRSTLLRLLNAGKYDEAAGQFSRWVYAGSQKLPGLIKRRDAEAKLFRG